MRRYFIYSGWVKRVFIFLPYGHSEEKNKSSFCPFEYMISLMHIGWGDYLSRGRRDFWRLLIRAAPFSIFGDIDMKQAEIKVQKEVKRLIAYIRNYNCYLNEHNYLISKGYCNCYGASLRVYPSEHYPWFNSSDLDYFRAWTIVTDWSFIVESKNGVAVLTFYYHI